MATKKVYIGENDSADNWHEITDEEAEKPQTAEFEEEYKMLGDV